MIFSSLTFVVFYALVLALFVRIRSDRVKGRMLLVASYVFYGWWDWRFCGLMLASSVWSWFWGNRIAATEDLRRRRLLLLVGLAGDLGSLAFFKYANFFLESFHTAFGVGPGGALDIILPVGISFFTFQSMSYTIDLYRRHLQPCHDLERFLLFVSFFPQLVAGPIVRASEFLPQLERPLRTDRAQIVRGLQVFLVGLFQKIVVADNLSLFVDPVFAAPGDWHPATLWAALFAYAAQILCDFSGYSLMAIGIARTLGFELPENFRMPYLATSITDFWRRWHMSLSRWLRDYLYFSLGGNRKGPTRTDVNLFLTMLLGGLWHGAGWNFVLWGGAHGVALFVHKRWRAAVPEAAPGSWQGRAHTFAAWALTLLFCVLLWVPFRTVSFADTWTYLTGLFTARDGILWLHTPSLVLLALVALWHLLRAAKTPAMDLLPHPEPGAWAPLTTLALLAFGVLLFAQHEASPFLYFQF